VDDDDVIRFVTNKNKGGVAAVQEDKDKDKPHIFYIALQ
jgi:hypothetical protein